ncbi:MAG: FAD-dependent oxidoreductase [Pseudomonadota bacterium]|nr:FAD-dependent oxidoreductase [Pseudomonadota bacterium]
MVKIAVVGAGIVGVTSAYELTAAGHDVTVFEQGGSVAAEASFGHAGLDGPGCAVAWSPLAVSGSLLGLALRGRLPDALTLEAHPTTCAWTLKWLQANRSSAQRARRHALHQIAAYSRARMTAITRALRLDFERSDGVLVVARIASDLNRMLPALAGFDEDGVRFNRLSPDQCFSVEPGLNRQAPLHAAVHLPDEGAGNCREFAQLMKQHAQRLGARFVFNAQVLDIQPGLRPELTLARGAQPARPSRMAMNSLDAAVSASPDASSAASVCRESFDAVLVCAALSSRRLLARQGLKLPLIGVHGHSVTAPLRLDEVDSHVGPNSVVLDARHLVTISRTGSRVRVSGGAMLGGETRSRKAASLRQLYQTLDDWFPGAARVAQAQHWQGKSPTLPDGLPVIGPSGMEGVWLNLGHGSVGWTLSCGSAQLLTAMMGGVPPDIDMEGLGSERFR